MLAIASLISSGCGEATTHNSLAITAADDASAGLVAVEARWSYRSSEVDIDIWLRTREGLDTCTSSAGVRVDKAIVGSELHRLGPIDCDEVRLSRDGDLIVLGASTGHDWSSEALDVDTDREIILLGPWRDESTGIDYRFALNSTRCPPQRGCECHALERRANAEVLSLQLGRTCD
jgi:hypothetical protein